MMQVYDDVSFRISKIVTRRYSTSFSIAVSFLNTDPRNAIYSIYGFVRFADEIVDTFHDFEKDKLFEKFECDLSEALQKGISLNPVLHSFQKTVKKYGIPYELISSFMNSMKSDLLKTGNYNDAEFGDYIYGSAEAVGLMCLCVFTGGDRTLYDELRYPAMKLGAAFQKINFLRDLRSDVFDLKRNYFPGVDIASFNHDVKSRIINDINSDFSEALYGIKKLPHNCKLPVLIAYYYYRHLLVKIRNTPPEELITRRISVNSLKKFFLLNKAYLAVKMKIV
ncbi:MAG TPA: phytoene/squalene synthase family protein [Bacteroidales bacterium]|nr:phytoene/squalene synthase family protein [Bacteroidales bacterium]